MVTGHSRSSSERLRARWLSGRDALERASAAAEAPPGPAVGDDFFDGLLEAAVFGHADEHRVLLAAAEDQELRAALGARLGNRLLPELEVALMSAE